MATSHTGATSMLTNRTFSTKAYDSRYFEVESGMRPVSYSRGNKMTPTTQSDATNGGQKFGTDITRTVFDLSTFDDVKLRKAFPLPAKPETVAEALALVGNDNARLLDLIYKGVVAAARDEAAANIQGFVTDDDEATPYTGRYADEVTGKKIDNAILALAKVNGYEKSLPKERKDAIKADVTKFLRENPGMLKGIMGSTPVPSAE